MKKIITLCKKKGITPIKPNLNSKLGLAINSFGKGREINGLRHPPENGTNGWYIWEGDFLEKDNFFSPICLKHIEKYVDFKIDKYLILPPGFRFLIDKKGYEDIWFDKSLLDI